MIFFESIISGIEELSIITIYIYWYICKKRYIQSKSEKLPVSSSITNWSSVWGCKRWCSVRRLKIRRIWWVCRIWCVRRRVLWVRRVWRVVRSVWRWRRIRSCRRIRLWCDISQSIFWNFIPSRNQSRRAEQYDNKEFGYGKEGIPERFAILFSAVIHCRSGKCFPND